MNRWFTVGLGLVALGHSVLAVPMPHSFSLQPHNEAVEMDIDVDLTSHGVTFTKEPAGLSEGSVRGGIPLAEGSETVLGFVWDENNQKLYLDLNRNQDLTDDPQGIFSADEGWVQEFSDIHVQVDRDGFPVRSRLSLSFSRFGSHDASASATIHSGWEGLVALDGQSWRLGVIDNLNGEIGTGDRFMLTAISSNGAPRALGDEVGQVAATSRLFLGGQGYDVAFNFEVGDPDTTLAATFTPIDMPTGELQLDGDRVARIVLEGEVTAILDHPAPTTRVPVGTYESVAVYVTGVSNADVYATEFDVLDIQADTATPLTTGAPLNNSVIARRSGRSLSMNYQLLGRGGREFDRVSGGGKLDDPTFVIRRGGQQVASGSFEYG